MFGNPKTGWGGAIFKPCYNGVYANEHAAAYIKEMMETHDIDGVWENSVGFGDGPCYCPRCRDGYQRAAGEEIPEGADYASPVFARYRKWKAECAMKYIRLMRGTVKGFGQVKAYCAEVFGMFHASAAIQTGIDLYVAKDCFDFLVSPAFLDGAAQPDRIWDDFTFSSSSMKFLRSICPDKQVVMLTGNNGTKWRYAKAPSVETRLWMWGGASVGSGFWNCMFNGQHPGASPDRRNSLIESPIHSYLKENEELLQGLAPVADGGIFFSKPTRDSFGSELIDKDRYGLFIKGAERALTQSHIQFSFVPDLGFSLDSLRNVKVLLLTNAAAISDGHASAIREFVRAGGGLVATYESSLYDEEGARREDFALGDLFGVSFTGIIKDTSTDCCQRVVDPEHGIFEGMQADLTDVLMNGGETLLCVPRPDARIQCPASYIPRIFNQPPEFAWMPDAEIGFPTIATSTFGMGRVVYFANQADKLCYTNGHEDFVNLYRNAVKWAANSHLSLEETDMLDSVQITLARSMTSPSGYVLSFVNTSGGLRPLRHVAPVRNSRCRLFLGAKLEHSKSLCGNAKVSQSSSMEPIEVVVEELDEFASIFINTCSQQSETN
ncbi:MAG: hypothetical protein LBU32_01220 [Clostridiales bacterium]|nr:hypothetical protein [Clostridiales bacterium]